MEHPSFEQIKRHLQQQEKQFGYTNPHGVAEAICGSTDHTLFTTVKRSITRIESREFLYDGAEETLAKLLQVGDFVRIWTQGHEEGQKWKVAMSGINKLRKSLPMDQKNKYGVIVALDKIEPLPDTLSKIEQFGPNRIVIVDDKAKNIVQVDEKIKLAREKRQLRGNTTVTPVWINQGRTRDQVPSGYTVDTFKEKYTTITDIRELLLLREEYEQDQISWLIDFDHTLTFSAGMDDALCKKIAELFASQE